MKVSELSAQVVLIADELYRLACHLRILVTHVDPLTPDGPSKAPLASLLKEALDLESSAWALSTSIRESHMPDRMEYPPLTFPCEPLSPEEDPS